LSATESDVALRANRRLDASGNEANSSKRDGVGSDAGLGVDELLPVGRVGAIAKDSRTRRLAEEPVVSVDNVGSVDILVSAASSLAHLKVVDITANGVSADRNLGEGPVRSQVGAVEVGVNEGRVICAGGIESTQVLTAIVRENDGLAVAEVAKHGRRRHQTGDVGLEGRKAVVAGTHVDDGLLLLDGESRGVGLRKHLSSDVGSGRRAAISVIFHSIDVDGQCDVSLRAGLSRLVHGHVHVDVLVEHGSEDNALGVVLV